jgi:hypothetical protein
MSLALHPYRIPPFGSVLLHSAYLSHGFSTSRATWGQPGGAAQPRGTRAVQGEGGTVLPRDLLAVSPIAASPADGLSPRPGAKNSFSLFTTDYSPALVSCWSGRTTASQAVEGSACEAGVNWPRAMYRWRDRDYDQQRAHAKEMASGRGARRDYRRLPAIRVFIIRVVLFS